MHEEARLATVLSDGLFNRLVMNLPPGWVAARVHSLRQLVETLSLSNVRAIVVDPAERPELVREVCEYANGYVT